MLARKRLLLIGLILLPLAVVQASPALDVPGKTLANHIGTVSGVDWNGNALIGRGVSGMAAGY